MEKGKTVFPENVKLEVVEGEDRGLVYNVVKKAVLIGRDEKCDLKLKDIFVSKRQCELVFRGKHFTVLDLGSLNKTRVNDKALNQKKVQNGDIIQLGKTRIKFVWEK
jgi:pSer/pThr/pTyr-binding forkhead associated (FHA) protein